MNVVCIIQARLNSTRLPRKVLLPIGDYPAMQHTIKRAQQLFRTVMLAIPDTPENDELVDYAKDEKLWVYRGPEEDVLMRYAIGALLSHASHIVRLTADCPFIDHPAMEAVIGICVAHSQRHYISNIYPTRTYPRGLDVEIFTAHALGQAMIGATEPYDREHVTPWIQRTCAPQGGLTLDEDLSSYRWTLDTQADYQFLQRVAAELPCDPIANPPRPTMRELADWCRANTDKVLYDDPTRAAGTGTPSTDS